MKTTSAIQRMRADHVSLTTEGRGREPYRVVCADPPWPFKDKLPGTGRGAGKNYDLLTIVDLMRFSFVGGHLLHSDRIADDAYLFLWRVSARELVESAYQVCRAWNFDPVTEFVWSKLTRHGKQHFGMGWHLRMSHETCIVATRGKPKPLVRNLRSVLEAPAPSDENGRAIHSKKPSEFYSERVERISNGPYLELFAREHRPGWTCVGKELQ